jgi:TetR/AcrR family transcriptional repressor of mexJK operon
VVQQIPGAGAPPRRGRPPDPRKRRAIARAATRLFLQRGFAGTSMDAVARAAGVSKLTVYAHFGDKDRLFQAIVRERCDAYNQPGSYETRPGLPVRDALCRIGRNFMGLILDPEVLRLHRVMVGEAARRPKMAELFFAAGPERTTGLLAEFLARGAERGDLELADPRLAADQFHALLTGMPHFRATLNVGPRLTPQQVHAHVERCVDLFLRGYGTGPGARGPDEHSSRGRAATRPAARDRGRGGRARGDGGRPEARPSGRALPARPAAAPPTR